MSLQIAQLPSFSWLNNIHINTCMGFPGGSAVRNPPAVQEMQIPSLSLEDPLEEEMATHSSVLARKFPWTEELGGLQRVWHHWATEHTHKYILSIIIMMQYTWKSYLFDILISFSLDLYSEVGLEDYMVFFFFNSWETSILFSIVTTPTCTPTKSAQVFPFLHILVNTFFCGLFDDSHSDRSEMMTHCGLICISLMNSCIKHFFHVPVHHLYAFIRKMSILFFCQFFNRTFWFSIIEFFTLYWVLNINTLSAM